MRREEVPSVKRRGKRLIEQAKLATRHIDRPCCHNGHEAIVGTDEPAPVRLHCKRPASAPDTRIHDAYRNSTARKLRGERRQKMRCGRDVEGGKVVREIDDCTRG